VLIAVIVFLIAASSQSGATLSSAGNALARVHLQSFAGHLERAEVFGPDGRVIPMSDHDGLLVPREPLPPGEQVTVQVTVRRSSTVSWLLGRTHTVRLSLRTPVARPTSAFVTVPTGAPVSVRFNQPVRAVAFGTGAQLDELHFASAHQTVALGRFAPVGSVKVRAAARSWETLGPPSTITWFPASAAALAVPTPGVGSSITPTSPIRVTFSAPVSRLLGSTRPTVSPNVPGTWSQPDSHTLQFTPTGIGIPLGTPLKLTLPRAIAVSSGGALGSVTRTLAWVVPPGSTRRLQQLLAQLGYLPVTWTPSGAPVAQTEAAQVAAAVNPPAGTFSWRYGNTPGVLKAMWQPGQPSQIDRGAIMMFEQQHNLTVDALAGAHVWADMIKDAIAGRIDQHDYSYVYVRTALPQLLTLWSDGHTVLTSPGNTGQAAAPTQAGTFPVFEHIPVGTMSGTNPGGSSYNDPGIQWISYFNGGDALHAFPRGSYGTPQSLGCVEMPLDEAAKVWPYTPIGTLVTIEPSSYTTNT
jgi:hypothetical protein